jgi:hypothetical protein
MVFEPTSAGLRPTTAHPWPHVTPEERLHPDSREASELLESLDDAMFAALAGDEALAGPARELWLAAVRLLPCEVVLESREQYLRFATDGTRRSQPTEVRDAAQALIALELIEFLMGD